MHRIRAQGLAKNSFAVSAIGRADSAPSEVRRHHKKFWKTYARVGVGLFLGVGLPLYNYNQKFKAATANPPDFKTGLVVVLTGAKGRFAYALQHLGPKQQLFVTGAAPGQDFKWYCRYDGLDPDKFKSCEGRVSFGIEAQTTCGNAAETIKHLGLKENLKISSLTIITSDYHVPRAYGEMKRALDAERYRISFAPVPSEEPPFRLEISEMYKLAWRSYGGSTCRIDTKLTPNPVSP